LRCARSDPYGGSRVPRHAHSVERERHLPGCDPDAHAVSFCDDTAGVTDANCDSDGNNATGFTDALGDAASTDAKAAAHATSSADAVNRAE
jgi:hypothetical protein